LIWPAVLESHGSCTTKKIKRKEKTTPFGVNLMRSQVLYLAAQASQESQDSCGRGAMLCGHLTNLLFSHMLSIRREVSAMCASSFSAILALHTAGSLGVVLAERTKT